MKDRIKQFIEDQKLTATQFADEIGVQRSSISHVLSGRNHPGYEFIQKMLKKYPFINVEWLMLGKGDMFKSDRTTGEPSLFTNVNSEDVSGTPDDTVQTGNIKSEDPPRYGLNEENFAGHTPAKPDAKNKNVERVVIFYSDYTFDEYYPNKT